MLVTIWTRRIIFNYYVFQLFIKMDPKHSVISVKQ